MKSTDVRKNRPCLYEIALCLAIAKAPQDEFRWERFIDNLSQICDTFAYQIEAKGTAFLGNLTNHSTNPFPYCMEEPSLIKPTLGILDGSERSSQESGLTFRDRGE